MIKNLSQLKKKFNEELPTFEIVDHCRKECIGQIRKVNISNTVGFYSIVPDDLSARETKANDGKGSFMAYVKASRWKFNNGLCSSYLGNGTLIMSFKIINH